MVFKNSDVFVENLQCDVLNNAITMDGQAKSLLTLINTQPDNANINWNIHMPVMNLGSFLYMFKSKEKDTRKSERKSTLETMADKIDDFVDRGRFQVKLNAGKLIYKDFEGRNALADITLLTDRYIINNVSMDHSGGHISVKGNLLSQANYYLANLDANMDHVDVSKLFTGFNNLGQDVLTAQSLEGKLSTASQASL